jgi:hypothetical protein
VAIDRQPDWGVTFYVTGTGFAPDVDLKATFISPTGTSSLGGPDDPTKPRMIHTTPGGWFGPWDIVHYDPQVGEGGDYEIELTDGECTVSVADAMPVSDGAPAPIRCQLALDRVPDWGVAFNVLGHAFPADAGLSITIDEPFSSSDWQWPGLPPTNAQGDFGPLDLRYSEPVAGDGGDYVMTATAGGCTATLTFTLPEP